MAKNWFLNTKRKLDFLFLGTLLVSCTLYAQKSNTFSGTIIDAKKQPIPYATIWFLDINKGAFANEKGIVTLKNIPIGAYEVKISCLGYAEIKTKITLKKGETNQTFVLQSKSYALDDIVITAKQNKENTSTYTIDNDAIEHVQATNIYDIMSLLPGGKTSSKELLSGSSNRISVRSEQSETDNPDFGTAIEVDGVRLSNNAGFGSSPSGVDTRIIDPNSVEKIKIIAGIPSVEYSDLTSGLVKIETKQGVMPLNIRASATPRQKQVSLSKGFQLNNNAGVLNVNYDFTKSTGNVASPYTSYIRNAFTVKHKKTFFSSSNVPLTLQSTVAGNFGGYNSEADPDEFKDSYTKQSAFNIRGGINANWQLNTKWVSGISFAVNVNYSDKKYEQYYYDSSASATLAFHGTEEGYFVGQLYNKNEDLAPLQLLNRGYWSQTRYNDSKPINYSAKLKLQKNIFTQNKVINVKAGANFSGSGNEGKGVYYQNRAYIPTWHEHNYSSEPYLNNLGLYAEGQFKYKFNKQQSVKVTAGLRNDYTFVKDSRYGNVSALSPRFNIRHTILNNKENKYFKKISWYAGWGQSVKLPSFGTLYTTPSYLNRLAFVPGALADGTAYYAYYIQPSEVIKNENLVWQKSRQFEVGVQGKFKGVKFSATYFNSLGLDRYTSNQIYTPFTYYLTSPDELVNVQIPNEYRQYTISQEGTVTVHDNRGILPDEVLDKNQKNTFKSSSYTDNGSPVKRQGIEWVLDFGKIKPLYTSLRLDGKYYTYKYINTKVTANYLGSNQLMSNGELYQYIGYYYGGNSLVNGKETKRLNINATFITHIPKVRLIVSLKLEGTFINSSQSLSEMSGGSRSFAVDNVGETFYNGTGSIYDGNHFAVMYPLYYTTFDDPDTQIPFAETYAWAYENDKTLYNDLTKMVKTTSRRYHFKKSSISPYFSANINVSKEIGKRFKLTFYANNFLNTMARVKYSQEDIERTLLNSSLVPTFSYGLSLNIKL